MNMKPAFILILTMSFALAMSCGGGGSSISETQAPRLDNLKAKGFVYSPKSITNEDANAYFSEVSTFAHGSSVWNTPWRDDYTMGSDAGTFPNLSTYAANKATSFGVINIGVFNWRIDDNVYIRTSSDNNNTWANADARLKYKNMVVSYCKTYQPPYICLGNENEFYFRDHPEDYGNWISLYNETYKAIKATTPQVQVGPVFNFENLSGHESPGVFHDPYWGALEAHDLSQVDFIGLTLYPMLFNGDPLEIPSDYLSPLFDRIGSTPIGITETGWPAEKLGDLALPWQTSEVAQLNFLATLKTILDQRSIIFLHWLVLNPIPKGIGLDFHYQVFGSISVRDANGEKRSVYDPWFSFPTP